MGDGNTKEVPCRDCGAAILRRMSGPGKPKILCNDCLAVARRANTTRYKRRVRAEAMASVPDPTCVDCGVTFARNPRGRTSTRCAECRIAARRQELREYQRQLRATNQRPKRKFFCETCGIAIERKGGSGVQRYCQPCGSEAALSASARAEAKRAVKRRSLRPTTVPCVECQAPRPTPRGGPFQRRCSDCSKRHQKKLMRPLREAHAQARRARKRGAGCERFHKREIFDRDGWRCGICRRKIRKDLRWPHPMSASLDHIVPLARGGAHTRANARASHLRCNMRHYWNNTDEQLALIG